MATVNVLNWKKEKIGQVELSSDVFEVEVKKDVLHTVVRWQLASRRAGTHMTKTKGFPSSSKHATYFCKTCCENDPSAPVKSVLQSLTFFYLRLQNKSKPTN